MTLSSPAYLWILAALLPLIAIYLLRVKPRRLPVNAFFLWEKIFEQRRASSLFQRLRDVISLLLLMLVVGMLALAASGPRHENEDGRDLLLVVDISPSMRAKVGGKDVCLLAKNHAREIGLALNGTRRIALAVAAGELRFLCHLSAAPSDLLDALARVEASDVPVSPATIRSLNALAGQAGKRHRILLLTDGHGGWDGIDPAIEVIHLGAKSANAGLVAADLAWASSGGNRARFYYRIASSLLEETHAELELRNEDSGELARLLPVVLKPGADVSGTADVDGATAGRWKALLKLDDALIADNEVALGLAERRPVGVRIGVKDDYFFGRCVEAFAQTGGILARVESGADLAICQGAPTEEDRQLVFAPSGDSPFWNGAGDAVEVLAAEAATSGHPLVRNLDLDAIRFEGARRITPTPGSIILARSESGDPLMWKAQAGEKIAVVVNLDPALGDFFLFPWFPALVHDAALHLADRENSMSSVYPTGSKVSANGRFTDSDGNSSNDRMDLARRGFLQVEQANQVIPFGAAVLDVAETKLDGSGPAARSAAIARGQPFAFWLILAAVAVLVFESMLYHRRKAA